ncbi:MAG: hypothetical protein KME47_10665 [Nodosilinea sp. WJT8-NPBG4]|jgi:hypothetical protein|nr:hypothetical protein [Nodosilinea sp. WJT8-NPBG4]
MDIAKSMYLGGKEINASNSKLKTDSYRELGLKCVYCEEPVFHKNGYYNKAHFSHFPSIDPRKYEECLIRQRSVNGISFSSHSWWQHGGDSQRFDLFQQHFFYILKSEFPDMEIKEISVDPQDVELSEVQLQVLKIAAQNKSGTDKYLRICDDRFADIEIDIIIEVLDYITKSSSRNIFKALSEYSIKRLLKAEGAFQSYYLEPEDLYYDIVNIIISVPWLKVLARITDVKIEELYRSIKAAKRRGFLKKISYSSAESKSYIYCHISKVFIADIDKYSLSNEVEIAKIDMRRMLLSKWVSQAEKVPISVDLGSSSLKISRQNSTFFNEAIKRQLTIEIGKAINAYIEDNESLEVSFWHPNLGKICLDESIEDFLEARESKVFLVRNSSPRDIALIRINESSIKYQNYIFNSNCVKVTDEYRRLIKEGNLEVEKAVAELLQEIHSLLKR